MNKQIREYKEGVEYWFVGLGDIIEQIKRKMLETRSNLIKKQEVFVKENSQLKNRVYNFVEYEQEEVEAIFWKL